MKPGYLVVGLGNPGKKYKSTRHNVGFMVCDYISSFFDLKFRFGPGTSQVLQLSSEEAQVLVAKPLTYMNLSGHAVVALLHEYEIDPSNLLVVYDDYQLPLGTLRIRAAGSSGNHNGIQSIIDQTGTKEFPRMRFGIGREYPVTDSVKYVLANFRKSERAIIEKLIPVSVNAIRSWITAGIERTMANFNQDYNFESE